MTREEALETWLPVVEMAIVDANIPEAKEALEMAIKALEQQDKVSDAIKEIRDLFKQPAAYVPNYDAYGLCLSIICKHMEVEV